MFYSQTFFLLQICSLLDFSQHIPEKRFGGHRARLREKENLFPYRAQFEGNLLHFVRARAHVRALMTRKSCTVEMRNAILRNYLNIKTWQIAAKFTCSGSYLSWKSNSQHENKTLQLDSILNNQHQKALVICSLSIFFIDRETLRNAAII